jgi:HEAT repeat protein
MNSLASARASRLRLAGLAAALVLGLASAGLAQSSFASPATSLPTASGKTDRYDALLDKLIKILNYGDLISLRRPSKLDAITALGILADERTIPALVDHLENESDQNIRYQIIKALGWIGSPQAVPALEKALRDTYPLSRKLSAAVLKTITGRDYEYDKTGLPDMTRLLEQRRKAESNSP